MTAAELAELRRCIDLCDRIQQLIDQIIDTYKENHEMTTDRRYEVRLAKLIENADGMPAGVESHTALRGDLTETGGVVGWVTDDTPDAAGWWQPLHTTEGEQE